VAVAAIPAIFMPWNFIRAAAIAYWAVTIIAVAAGYG
jgi:hypothetical protein